MRISDWSSDVCSSDLTIGTASSSVTNSGAIWGAGAGITTSYLYDEEIGQLVCLAVGTTVENRGTIAGEGNDGVRLIGGGSVTNSGTISGRSAEHTSELQSLMRISYAVFCLQKKTIMNTTSKTTTY